MRSLLLLPVTVWVVALAKAFVTGFTEARHERLLAEGKRRLANPRLRPYHVDYAETDAHWQRWAAENPDEATHGRTIDHRLYANHMATRSCDLAAAELDRSLETPDTPTHTRETR